MKILYIPGLGEGLVLKLQKRYIDLLNIFRSEKNSIVFFMPLWESDESGSKKITRLRNFYDEHGCPPTVVALSAGGALAIQLVSDNKHPKAAHIVCGKIQGSQKIGQTFQKRAPALVSVVRASEDALSKLVSKSVFCYAPDSEFDGVVEREDMIAEHSQVVNLPSFTHTWAIAYWLVRYLPKL